jgi:hypothetical protein
VANNNYPQITSVTSEALQQQIRNLLPSQEGFGTDLMAQNVIVPVIDLTGAAEGSTVPQNLQTAHSFASGTSVFAQNATVTIANTAGFWRITGLMQQINNGSTAADCSITASDGLSTKTVFRSVGIGTNSDTLSQYAVDFVAFLESGDTWSAVSTNGQSPISLFVRQIADVNGNLVNPIGFTPQ